MAEPSDVYQGSTPAITNGGLNPLQLNLANFLAVGNPPPFAINQAFLETMKTYSDPGQLTPFDIDNRTGLPRVPDLNYDINEGIAYIYKGSDVYLLRRAPDCGPDENRLEQILLGPGIEVAAGTWAFYGTVVGGSASGGAGGDYGGGEISGFTVSDAGFTHAGLQGSQGFDSLGNFGPTTTALA
jgi:hypothetical protein